MVRPGVTTEQIDQMVHEETIKRNAYPSPLNYHDFPKSCCTSVNEVICHGIPDMRALEDGDIVNIDITVFKDGFHGDLNETFLVGNVAPAYKKLIRTTYESLQHAINAVKPGVACRDFGTLISKHVNAQGYQVVKTYCGHGIGDLFHCAPNIPHYARMQYFITYYVIQIMF
jgi:methionyl aminopeptidase